MIRGVSLTGKRLRFVKEYLIDLNATRAAISAGYSARTAAQAGSRLLRDVQIHAEIEQANAKRLAKVELSAELVLKELIRIGMADLSKAFDADGRLLPLHKIPEDTRRAMSSVKVFEEFAGAGKERIQVGEVREVKFWDKPKALELLGKHLKLFVDVAEVGGAGGGPIVFRIEE
jgi:phage terminase small subunit